MNYGVLKPFIDKETLVNYDAGAQYPCVDAKRAEVLIERGYIKENDAEAEPKTAKAKPKRTPKKKA